MVISCRIADNLPVGTPPPPPSGPLFAAGYALLATRSMTRVVALTGNIASGKSEVARRLAALGATVIDADVLAREVVEPDQPAYDDIVRRWGARVLLPNGHLDRGALRSIVFADDSEREALNAIVHPRVAARRDQLVAEARARGASVIICDIPLLFETGLDRDFEEVILVDAPVDVRRARLIARGLTREEAGRMMAAQMPATMKRHRAEYVVETNGTLPELQDKVAALWHRLNADP